MVAITCYLFIYVKSHVKSGVPPGTILGPILFLIYVNDASTKITSKTKIPCNLQRDGVALQVARKTSSCDTPCLQLVSQRTIALQVAEKVEAASTFRNVTRQVAACDTPTATCLGIFLRRNQSQYDIIRMPLTFLNTRRA